MSSRQGYYQEKQCHPPQVTLGTNYERACMTSAQLARDFKEQRFFPMV